jgi:CDP-glucose 4,6-dehydratase
VDAKTVEWVADRLTQVWGRGAAWDRDAGQHPHEARVLRLDWSKARDRLGWHPQIDLAKALDATALWYSAWQAGEDMREFTRQQIGCFCDRGTKVNQDAGLGV